jgi:sugar phosphate isomerase/epimerase
VVDEVGTPICLTHIPQDRLLGETEKVIEENLSFGNKNIGLGSMSWEIIVNETECKKKIEEYNRVGEIMQKNGCRFFWHHHNFEFIQYNGQTVMDFVIDNAPHINFTLDTYWLQLGGMNVIEYLERLKGRIGCVHLKDYKTIYNQEQWKYQPEIESVGYGVLNFQSIINKMREVGVEHYFVEQDNAADKPDTLHQVERSIQYLKANIK